MRPAAIALLALLAVPALAATSPDEMLADPALEARARALGHELRCLVCQNQSIDDSDADLARDLRRLVRERLTAGDSDAEAKAFLVARYGDFVLLEPPFRPSTWLLWLGPAAGLLSAGAWLALRARRRHTNIGEPLSDAERARLDRLLAEPGDR
ncbi:MAG TPA: cytochrome c-type biogenesis protein CcmH [Geminicoccaceae bacterium]|nr:cytochrome c-type biogenesis protein CcmH [Geminicoccus sp.]HMU48731.1 cytochrome c-type biogenesis protein CcmH [Geminicoccaceae bacterium]